MDTAAPPAPPEADGPDEDAPDVNAAWTNDDILFTKPARMALGARHPGALRVLNWPELRALFTKYEVPANTHGRRDRRFGLISIGCAALALVAAAFAPVAVGFERYLGALALAFTLGGTALAAFHWLGAESHARWLGNRYWTERIRGFYFQTLVNHLDLVARAMRDDAALAEWRTTRARALEAMTNPGDLPGQIRKLAAHAAAGGTWTIPDWETVSPTPPPSADLDLLLGLLRGQRFDIQLAYAEGKLGASLRAPRRRSDVLRLGREVLPPAAVILAGVAGGLLAFGIPLGSVPVKLALAFAAGAASGALALRVVDDGLLISGDTGRYAWYATSVRALRNQFDGGDLDDKLTALREMETVAYRDLQAFVTAHWEARYIL